MADFSYFFIGVKRSYESVKGSAKYGLKNVQKHYRILGAK